MSQIFKPLTSSGPIPPIIATSYVTNFGTAVPAANILNVLGADARYNNDSGIETDGSGNTVTVVLTNRVHGSGTTVGAVTADIITFAPTTTGVYTQDITIAAFNTTSSLGAGYSYFGAIRYDGVNAFICDAFDPIDNSEGTMTSCSIDFIASGANVILRVTGYAGQTINWKALSNYTYVGP